MGDDMSDLTRRTLIRAGIAVGAGIAWAGTANAASESEPPLRIATWGGSWRDSVAKNIVGKLDLQGTTVDYVLGIPMTIWPSWSQRDAVGRFPSTSWSVIRIRRRR